MQFHMNTGYCGRKIENSLELKANFSLLKCIKTKSEKNFDFCGCKENFEFRALILLVMIKPYHKL